MVFKCKISNSDNYFLSLRLCSKCSDNFSSNDINYYQNIYYSHKFIFNKISTKTRDKFEWLLVSSGFYTMLSFFFYSRLWKSLKTIFKKFNILVYLRRFWLFTMNQFVKKSPYHSEPVYFFFTNSWKGTIIIKAILLKCFINFVHNYYINYYKNMPGRNTSLDELRVKYIQETDIQGKKRRFALFS